MPSIQCKIQCKKGADPHRRGEPAPFHFTATLKSAKGTTLLSARGQTREEALATLDQRIGARFQGEWFPVLLFFRDYGALLYRSGDQWVEQYFSLEGGDLTLGGSTWGAGSREEIAREARLHLAERQWDGREEQSPILSSTEEQETFATWARAEKLTQRRCRLLRQHGWQNEETAAILGAYPYAPMYGISKERFEALGDPLTLLKEFEQQEPEPEPEEDRLPLQDLGQVALVPWHAAGFSVEGFQSYWQVLDADNRPIATLQGSIQDRETHASLLAASPFLLTLVQQAVNTLSTLLTNIADAGEHRHPTEQEIYADVVHATLFLQQAIQTTGLVPEPAVREGVDQLIKAVLAQIAQPSHDLSDAL